MTTPQPGILDDVPRAARYLTFHVKPDVDPRASLLQLAALPVDDRRVIGIGPALVSRLGASIDGLRVFPHHIAAGVEVPSTPAALLVWLRGDDPGALVHETMRVRAVLDDAFTMDPVIESFRHREGRDLTGYVDGTENPKGEAATDAAFIAGRGPGLDGGSFMSVQVWVHDLAHFASLPRDEQDRIVGRTADTDEELEDGPAWSHVKRTAQESFTPPAFVLRRSMPFASGDAAGLVFVAFGHRVDAFEALLARMVGKEDGIVDAVFRFSRPITGAHFYCPPTRDGALDLRALGL